MTWRLMRGSKVGNVKRQKWTRRVGKENARKGSAAIQLTDFGTDGQTRAWTLQDEEEDQLVVMENKRRRLDQPNESDEMMNDVEVASLEWLQMYQ